MTLLPLLETPSLDQVEETGLDQAMDEPNLVLQHHLAHREREISLHRFYTLLATFAQMHLYLEQPMLHLAPRLETLRARRRSLEHAMLTSF